MCNFYPHHWVPGSWGGKGSRGPNEKQQQSSIEACIKIYANVIVVFSVITHAFKKENVVCDQLSLSTEYCLIGKYQHYIRSTTEGVLITSHVLYYLSSIDSHLLSCLNVTGIVHQLVIVKITDVRNVF